MKKTFLKITISILVIGIMVGSIIIINHGFKTSSSGEITIILVDEDLNILNNKKITYDKGTSLEQIIINNYDVEMDNGMVVKINELVSPNPQELFIKIYLNCDAATRGVASLKFNNGDTIRFVLTKTKVDGSLDEKFC